MEHNFDKWLQDEKLLPHKPRAEGLKSAWIEATRQAYEDAIQICIDEKVSDESEAKDDRAYNLAITHCTFSIRQRLLKQYEGKL